MAAPDITEPEAGPAGAGRRAGGTPWNMVKPKPRFSPNTFVRLDWRLESETSDRSNM